MEESGHGLLKVTCQHNPGGKVVPVLNQAPRHEYIYGEWKYSSTHS